MDPMLEENDVLSDIERTLQNAYVLFNFHEDFEGQLLNVDDDPIVASHGSKSDKVIFEKPSSGTKSLYKPSSPNSKNIVDMSNQVKVSLNTPEIKEIEPIPSQESISLPFLKDPVKNTIKEMQRVLNSKGECFPKPSKPSPEEILNLYSKDLGISLNNSCSPGEDVLQHNRSEAKVKQSKKDKKDAKRSKQSKAKTVSESKLDGKKRKLVSYNMLPSKENKLKELKNIYGSSLHKTKENNSESTLGSKSELSKTTSVKKLKQINSSSMVNSSALSKKSIKKNKKYFSTKTWDNDLLDENILAHERSSKLGNKRKKILVQRNNKESTKIQRINTKKLFRASLNSKDVMCGNKNRQVHFNNLVDRTVRANQSKLSDKANQYNQQLNKNNQNSSCKPIRKPEKIVKVPLEKQVSKTIFNSVSENSLQLDRRNSCHNLEGLEVDQKLDLISKNKSHQLQVINKTTSPLIKHPSKEVKFNIQNLPKDTLINKCDSIQDKEGILNLQTNIDNLQGEFSFMGQEEQQHYTLPTLSSRSKEVERFLNGHYKHLPFVIGQSTSKSHNLWVNIQEALSLINQKLPQSGDVESDIVDECGGSERASSILSTMTSKSVRKPHHCPAIISDSLYDIPEVDDTVVKSWEDNPECIKANIDPSCVRSRCSCSIQPVMSYKKVLKQIFGKGSGESSEISFLTDTHRARESSGFDQGGDSYVAELRKALVSFTEEFEKMNNNYEDMLKDTNVDKEELERLEIQLQIKEEEIREILAKFNEVKDFQHRATLDDTRSRVGMYSLGPLKSTTSIRLAQTLHRVQKFKESLKSRPSLSFLVKHSQNICY